jgi:hypothetical protein
MPLPVRVSKDPIQKQLFDFFNHRLMMTIESNKLACQESGTASWWTNRAVAATAHSKPPDEKHD